ncbi:SEMA3G isoform 3, partial [Pongo abelii]
SSGPSPGPSVPRLRLSYQDRVRQLRAGAAASQPDPPASLWHWGLPAHLRAHHSGPPWRTCALPGVWQRRKRPGAVPSRAQPSLCQHLRRRGAVHGSHC